MLEKAEFSTELGIIPKFHKGIFVDAKKYGLYYNFLDIAASLFMCEFSSFIELYEHTSRFRGTRWIVIEYGAPIHILSGTSWSRGGCHGERTT